MKAFAHLINQLDQTTKTSEKVAAFVHFLSHAQPTDQAWAVAIFSHRRPKRTVSTTLLRTWAANWGGVPDWLFEECYHTVGDLSETIALLLPPPVPGEDQPLSFWIQFLMDLEALPPENKQERVIWAWQQLDTTERFIFNKLITGAFRVGLSQQLMAKAVAQHFQVPETTVAHRLMGSWSPASTTLADLVTRDATDVSKPYPFYLAYPLEDENNVAALGDVAEWQVEHKWDGIRGQVIVRNRQLFVWSRGEELVTEKYPEFHVAIDLLPDGTVLDGEIMAWKNQQPLPFQELQMRIGRKKLSAKILAQVPVAFVAYDLLELGGVDFRLQPMATRRAELEKLVPPASTVLQLSRLLPATSWPEVVAWRSAARAARAEGVMLKRKDSTYRDGRRKGDWWKWKLAPFTVDAVLIYAMAGHGRRANLYTDYTFAVWNGPELVPFTKAYSGLTDAEIVTVDRWIRQHTIERFGPVRSVRPELVFEIAFEGIQASTRHKSGIALRFPRILRWRQDKPAAEADRLQDLLQLVGTVQRSS
jgi:DNA ligase-1